VRKRKKGEEVRVKRIEGFVVARTWKMEVAAKHPYILGGGK
jgi:hypothetical protein